MTDSVRTPPEELVNPASGLPPLRDGLRGVEPTSLPQPFPSHLGLSLECRQLSCVRQLREAGTVRQETNRNRFEPSEIVQAGFRLG